MQYRHGRVDDIAEKLVREIGFEYARDSAPMKVGEVFLSHDPSLGGYKGGYQLRRVVGHSTTAAFLSEERYDEAEMISLCMFALHAVATSKKRVIDNVLASMEKLKEIVPGEGR